MLYIKKSVSKYLYLLRKKERAFNSVTSNEINELLFLIERLDIRTWRDILREQLPQFELLDAIPENQLAWMELINYVCEKPIIKKGKKITDEFVEKVLLSFLEHLRETTAFDVTIIEDKQETVRLFLEGHILRVSLWDKQTFKAVENIFKTSTARRDNLLIVQKCFGIDGIEKVSLSTMAKEAGVTPSSMSSKKRQMLSELRRHYFFYVLDKLLSGGDIKDYLKYLETKEINPLCVLVGDLDLGSRIFYRLHSENIIFLGDLIVKDIDIRKIEGIADKSFEIIHLKLAELGFAWIDSRFDHGYDLSTFKTFRKKYPGR